MISFNDSQHDRNGGLTREWPVRRSVRMPWGRFLAAIAAPLEGKALRAGGRELMRGNDEAAARHLRKVVHLADGAFIAGFLALKQGRLHAAEHFLRTAEARSDRLGHLFRKESIAFSICLPEVDGESAEVRPDRPGVLMGLAEIYRRRMRRQAAVGTN